MMRMLAPFDGSSFGHVSGAGGLHGNYRSALAAHPGKPQGRPDKGSGSQPIRFHGLPALCVLPAPHIPDGLTITPITEVRQRCWSATAIMPD
ncbi:hypothetical protein, partial [Aurantimonas sp. A3-2-R12]|uniref:hypothetical protein n=1 Tax=Aurantimonas sp. A3-2-R12 TaxID=3114362 RepID=UPI002E17356E|nr:hypothetical protein [Aurantimonas sp. A3-2-R12]